LLKFFCFSCGGLPVWGIATIFKQTTPDVCVCACSVAVTQVRC
jgi:hypothetical protein